MSKQKPVDSLRESIRLLEIRQAEEGQILKEQFKRTYESLKLVNLVKSSLKELTDSSEIKNSLFESIISIFTGYLTEKVMIHSKSSPVMKIISKILQFGVTKLVSNYAETIRIFISDQIDKLLHPEVEIPQTEEE